MSKQQLQEFFEKVGSQPELREQLRLAETNDAVASLARNSGFDVLDSDVEELVTELLSDQELEAVTGGGYMAVGLSMVGGAVGAILGSTALPVIGTTAGGGYGAAIGTGIGMVLEGVLADRYGWKF